jgi:predicted transcriptional regulator
MLMYATSPTRAIVGTALLAAKTDCSADEAWALAGEELALDRGELADYLRGSRACLLWLDQVKPLTQPLEIAELRQRASFRPPQSYRYVKADDPSVVLELTAAIRGQQRREVVGSGLYQASVTGESGT